MIASCAFFRKLSRALGQTFARYWFNRTALPQITRRQNDKDLRSYLRSRALMKQSLAPACGIRLWFLTMS